MSSTDDDDDDVDVNGDDKDGKELDKRRVKKIFQNGKLIEILTILVLVQDNRK